MRIHYIKRAALSLCAIYVIRTKCDITSRSICHKRTKRPSGSLNATYSETFADESFLKAIQSSTVIKTEQNGSFI